MGKSKSYVIEDNMLYQLKADGSKELCKGESVFIVAGSFPNGGRIIVTGIRATVKQDGYYGEMGNNGEILIIPERQKLTTFRMGFAICHPDDEFDMDEGVRLALKRTKSSKRELVSNSYSLLGNDRCYMLVKDEMEYIQNNPDKYLNLFKK